MSLDVRDDRRYLESHEWAKPVDGVIRIGLSDFAQDELGDIVYVELPEEGETIEAASAFGVIESIKAVSDLYAPISGTVTARNESILDQPELVNDAPYDDGWFIEVEPAEDEPLSALLTPEEYEDQLA